MELYQVMMTGELPI